MLSEIAESIRYVQLETNTENYIDSEKQIVHYKGRLYISDYDNIYCYLDNGDYLFKIDQKGKGPQEYHQLRRFIINSYFETIEILDPNGKKIMRFDLDGNFLEEVEHELHLMNMFFPDKSSYYLYTAGRDWSQNPENKYRLFRIRRNDKKILSKYFEISNDLDLGFSSYFCENKNKTYYSYNPIDTIYTIDISGNLKPELYIDFGEEKSELLEQLDEMKLENFMETYNLLNNEKFIYISGINISNEIYYINYSYRNNDEKNITNLAAYSEKSNTLINASEIINDLDGMLINKIIHINNGELIYSIQASDIIEESKTNNTPMFLKALNKLNPITENDNPIYAFVKLKKF